ncbi:MAG: family 10 glycosylhydrolase [Clostridiales bacterium]|nr:family 10 glycosylhydrolase [Clostridiales bacterium]
MKKRIVSLLLAMVLLGGLITPVETQAAASSSDYRAVWFSYEDFQTYLSKNSSNTAATFTSYFTKVLNKCKKRGLNRIIVQVRPTSDAIYDSEYFPTSEYISGKQGKSISYDPLKIMVSLAHKKGIKIEAWINPYRVSFSTDYSKLSKDNPARIWHESSSASDRRNVLSYNGQLYYNPSSEAVRELIINGVKEIVENYDVDGIHMDDYFYPSFTSSNYKTAFDAKEYNASKEKKNGKTIKQYRRKQVNKLVKGIYTAVKAIDSSVVFGISPAGNIDNLNSKYAYYVNIKLWTNSAKYVDYIAPQIYWGFYHKTAGFAKMVDRWSSMVDQSKVKLYIGLPAYKVGHSSLGTTSAEKKELTSKTILRKMVKYCIKKNTDGIIVFDYADLDKTAAKKMGNYLKKVY